MHEPRFGADMLGDIGEEGDHIMLGLALDLVDPVDLERTLLLDRLSRLFRHDAELGQRIGGMRLDLEPDLEAGLRLPNGGHFRTGIARDHCAL